MRDANLEPPFLDEQEENDDWVESTGAPLKKLRYHGDVRRLMEIRDELLELQKQLADFDENDKLPEDPFSDDQ